MRQPVQEPDEFEFGILEGGEDHEATSIANELIHEEDIAQNFQPSIQTKEDATIGFLAGCVERRIMSSRFDCEFCTTVFDEDKIDGVFFENNKTQRPCKTTYLICKYTHKLFDKGRENTKFNYHAIFSSIKRFLSEESLFTNTSFDHEDGLFHKECFIDSIIDEYVRLYGTYVARCITLEQQQLMLRNKNKRTTIFSGQ